MASLTYFRTYLSFVVVSLVVVYTVKAQDLTGTWYVLGNLTKCSRVPNESPCNITRNHFVSDYSSRQYYKLMEKIYRLVRDIARLDSRPQCTRAYEAFLCAQYFPSCKKGQDPRYPNLKISRRIVHDEHIRAKCSRVIGACNSAVGAKFIGERYFLCDFLNYPRHGWEINRCVRYDEENRCISQKQKLPAWLRDQHDQEVQQFMNLTSFRVNHTLPNWCRFRIENFLCRHPICNAKGDALLTNYTRQRCSNELECARFVPGEVNVDAVCLTFPDTSSVLLGNLLLMFLTILLTICVA